MRLGAPGPSAIEAARSNARSWLSRSALRPVAPIAAMAGGSSPGRTLRSGRRRRVPRRRWPPLVGLEARPQGAEQVAELRPGQLGQLGRGDPEQGDADGRPRAREDGGGQRAVERGLGGETDVELVQAAAEDEDGAIAAALEDGRACGRARRGRRSTRSRAGDGGRGLPSIRRSSRRARRGSSRRADRSPPASGDTTPAAAPRGSRVPARALPAGRGGAGGRRQGRRGSRRTRAPPRPAARAAPALRSGAVPSRRRCLPGAAQQCQRPSPVTTVRPVLRRVEDDPDQAGRRRSGPGRGCRVRRGSGRGRRGGSGGGS